MKEDIKSKYPFVGQLINKDGFVALFVGDEFACNLSNPKDGWSDAPLNEFVGDWCEEDFTNITREYLANTYGRVESKEHAEFVVELAKNAGIECASHWDGGRRKIRFFLFYYCDDRLLLGFFLKGLAERSAEKQITIPMPPKEVEEVDEWPKVNDEVQFKPNPSIEAWVDATIQYQGDKFTILKSNTGREYSKRNSKLQMRKPKTPEEELRDEIELITKESLDEDYSPSANAEHIAGEIFDKFTITKKQ